jgi:anti-sigma factor RsiW
MSKNIEPWPRKDARSCIAPEVGARLREYYEGNLEGDEELEFEAHLLLCAECSHKVDMLGWIDETFCLDEAPGEETGRAPAPLAHEGAPPYENTTGSMLLGRLGGRSPAFYIAGGLGGISLLGLLTFGTVKLVRQLRRGRVTAARREGAQAGGRCIACSQPIT